MQTNLCGPLSEALFNYVVHTNSNRLLFIQIFINVINSMDLLLYSGESKNKKTPSTLPLISEYVLITILNHRRILRMKNNWHVGFMSLTPNAKRHKITIIKNNAQTKEINNLLLTAMGLLTRPVSGCNAPLISTALGLRANINNIVFFFVVDENIFVDSTKCGRLIKHYYCYVQIFGLRHLIHVS